MRLKWTLQLSMISIFSTTIFGRKGMYNSMENFVVIRSLSHGTTDIRNCGVRSDFKMPTQWIWQISTHDLYNHCPEQKQHQLLLLVNLNSALLALTVVLIFASRVKLISKYNIQPNLICRLRLIWSVQDKFLRNLRNFLRNQTKPENTMPDGENYRTIPTSMVIKFFNFAVLINQFRFCCWLNFFVSLNN